jgi:hypothetical protein
MLMTWSVGPQLRAVLAATTWQEREERLARVDETVASAQNALAVAAPQDPGSRPFHGRPYQVIMPKLLESLNSLHCKPVEE